MAEGGYYPSETPEGGWLKWAKNNPGYDDKEEGDVTRPFTPGEASTPYHRGEHVEMQTMQQQQQEHTGWPSYEETSFGGDDERAPLIKEEEDDGFDDINRHLAALRRNSVTGILDISKIPDVKENPLSVEEQNEQKERARRFMNSRYPTSIKKTW